MKQELPPDLLVTYHSLHDWLEQFTWGKDYPTEIKCTLKQFDDYFNLLTDEAKQYSKADGPLSYRGIPLWWQ
jgi:hypothetical protein